MEFFYIIWEKGGNIFYFPPNSLFNLLSDCGFVFK